MEVGNGFFSKPLFQGVLKVYTSDIRQCTDYKTIRVSTKTTARNVIEMVLTKFKLTCRDPNLFELWMEVLFKLVKFNG